MKNDLIKMIAEKGFNFSETPTFRLASGRMSCYYINVRSIALDPKGMFLIGNLVFQTIKNLPLSGIGGMTFGADPIAVSTAFASYVEGKPIKAFSIRKDKKGHGLSKWIEGDLKPGDQVIIIDDVATTGGSTIKAVKRAREEGLIVDHAMILVDREEGGLAAIREHVEEVTSLIKKRELMEFIGRGKT